MKTLSIRRLNEIEMADPCSLICGRSCGLTCGPEDVDAAGANMIGFWSGGIF